MDLGLELDQLVREHGTLLSQFAYQLTHSGPDAQDLVQQALLSVLQAGQSRDLNIRNGKAYLLRTISNAYLRAHRSQRPIILSWEEVDSEPSSDDAIETVVDRDTLWHLLGDLPERMRLVLVLRYFLDESDESIGGLLGVSAVTVRSISSRALARLRTPGARRDETEETRL